MERVELNAETREAVGTGAVRALRRQGSIPGVVYREGNSTSIKLGEKEIKHFINSAHGEQVMVSLKFSDGTNKLALMKNFQTDPVRGDLLHVDFYEVSLTEKVKITVPVYAVGEAVGVKRDGGILQQELREVEIECLPGDMVGHIDVDITELAVGQSIHVSNLIVSENIKMLTDKQETVVNVSAPIVEAEPEAAEEEAEAAEAEAEAEPEVIKKGKKEEEAGEAES